MPEDIPNMKGSWFFDKNFNGLSDETFDDLKFFDFPLEDVDANTAEEDWSALGEPCFDVFSVSPAVFCGKIKTENPQLGEGFSAPFNGISPIIKEAARTAGPTYGKTIPNQNVPFYEKKVVLQYSPVSVFEGSSASSVENSGFDLPVIPVKRARSKRRRPSSLNPVFSISFIASLQALHKKISASESDLNRVKKQKRMLSGDIETKKSSSQESVVQRKCTHCEVTETPQWREGPNGPKTLCNACGVRYRSGRLYPEYRPANSPTFVASVHSNSHKKVLEMRGVVIKDGVGVLSKLAPSNVPGNSVGQCYPGSF